MQKRGGGITTSCSKFFVLQYRKILLGNNSVYWKMSGIEIFFLHKKGISRFSVENFLSHSTEKLRRRTHLCFKKILVSKIFMYRRGASWFSRKSFVSQDRNDKPGKGTLLFSRKFLVSKNFLWVRGERGVSRFCSVKS